MTISNWLLDAIKKQLLVNQKFDISTYKEDFFRKNISRRIEFLNLNESSYRQHIEANPTESAALLQSFSIDCTSFFRDPKKYDLLKNTILPSLFLKNKNTKKLRIWSAGCAGGEEPYSIAIAVQDALLGKGDDWTIEILASDVNPVLLEEARAGVYAKSQLSKDAQVLATPHINPLPNHPELFEINQTIKNRIRFFHHNLQSDTFPENLDLIFCRNVLIYMNESFIRSIYEKFYAALNDDGFLLLGNFESLLSQFLAKFKSLKKGKEFFYQKIPAGSDYHSQMLEKQRIIEAFYV